ncbi:hypothetical protein [Planococcus sp. CAU13]|uniref:hypothetical protein n=1 Tax=Planococcus sp. CAU13 TaxID=1541197 RepID=UPI00053000AE|nr:hypothetical protein [Planococcus sp. CAU13]
MEEVKDIGNFSSKISERIWGHRFLAAQRGPEYVLEFLNVLVGTDYSFNQTHYSRKKQENFRKFIFEGSKEGSKRNKAKLDVEFQKALKNKIKEEDKIRDIQSFLRNLEVPLINNAGQVADRSWFAKSLYPLHESLLFFEVRVKNGDVSYERNFYARGGELYFLMIKDGVSNHPERRDYIEKRFRELLNENKSIYKFVSGLTEIFDEKSEYLLNGKDFALESDGTSKETPVLPIRQCDLYEKFSEELERILKLNIDIYEMFKFLTSLISFQLLQYMLYRATDSQKSEFFVDCLDTEEKPILKLSNESFLSNENLIKEKFDTEFNEFYKNFLSTNYSEENLNSWRENQVTKNHPLLKSLGLAKLSEERKKQILTVARGCKNKNDLTNRLYPVVKDMVSDQLKKSKLTIIRTLAKDGGVGGYRAGSKYRYHFSDIFLQTLVYSNLEPKRQMEFQRFLELLNEKYGIIIGDRQAIKSKIYEKSGLNIKYFKNNENALRMKLKQNGLLTEYSDATAMIINPYNKR